MDKSLAVSLSTNCLWKHLEALPQTDSCDFYLKDESSVVGLVAGVADEGGGETFLDEGQRDVGGVAEQPADEVSSLVHRFNLNLDLPLENQLLDEDRSLVAVGLGLDLLPML
jgi:hypothetical protein